jgi:hypothetical protein
MLTVLQAANSYLKKLLILTSFTRNIAEAEAQSCGAQSLTTAGHSEASYLAKSQTWYLKRKVNIFSVIILCVTKGPAGHLGKHRNLMWPTGHKM